MNIIRKLTYENLRRNKKRTIVTVIGIILSTALLCAAAGLVSSAQQSLINYEKAVNGDYHVMFEDVPAEAVGYITENADVESYFAGQNLGYAVAEESQNTYKPYFYVKSLDENGFAKSGLFLQQGRFPKNGSEVVLPVHTISNGQMEYKIGDVLTLEVGVRVAKDGTVLTQMNPFDETFEETVINTQTMQFTIVGLINRPSQQVENFSAPGYTLFTYLEKESDVDRFVGVRFEKPAKWFGATKKIASVIAEETGREVSYDRNQWLLRYEGALSDNDLGALYAVGAIILIIIIGTSVFVIRNSFRISVAEKTAQYGMLSSVGATSKQIRDSVLYEGFLIGLIGIPLGILGGTFALAVLARIVNALLPIQDIGFSFTFHLPWYVILLAVFLGALTIFLSSLIPAVQAGKIPPIVAIRGNQEYKVSKKQVRISPLTKKLFGIGGVIAAKNLKRSKSKYRTTVVSLVVSIVVFVSLSSFVGYTKRATGVVYTDYQFNLEVTGIRSVEEIDPLMEAIGEENYSYSKEYSLKVDVDTYGSEIEKKMYQESYDSTPEEYRKYMYYNCSLVALNQDYFERFAKSLGYTENLDSLALVADDQMTYTETDGRVLYNCYGDLEQTGLAIAPISYVTDDSVEIFTEPVKLKEVHRLDKRPMGYEATYTNGGYVFVSENYLTELPVTEDGYFHGLYIMSKQPSETENKLLTYKGESAGLAGMNIYNLEKNTQDEKNMILLIEIFLYGFITVITLVGVTNIFNTITTNMILRSKEFAMLKSVGMTTAQFHRMIRLESLLYGAKSLAYGIPLGILGSVLIYRAMSQAVDLGYLFPMKAILIAAVFVFLIVGLTMWYSLAKIEKQNIVETIRNDAI